MTGEKRPNLLFVFADQHRGMDLGCTGNPDLRTPNIDRLAREGRQFENAYANVPVCGPSRATLLSGQYPLDHGVLANDIPLPESTTTIAEVLHEEGYRTGYVGKWHLDGVPRDKFTPPGSRRQGFDDFWAAWNCSHDYLDAKYYRDSSEPIEVDGYEPVKQTDLAMEFIDADDDRPFCLFLSYGPPHDPYDRLPVTYKDAYDPADIALRPNAELVPPDAVPAGYSTEADLREDLAHYYAQITALDEQVGRLMDHLDQAGLADETLFVYTADHGDMVGSQGRMTKQWPWEESINIPLIVRWPGEIPAGSTDNTLVSTVDMAPTLLNATVGDAPETMEGTDLSSALRGESMDSPESVFLATVVPVDREGVPAWRGVRTARYTYARLQNGSPWILYDNERDPYQQHNRALSEDRERLRDRLDRLVDDWLAETDDQFLPPERQIKSSGIVTEWTARQEAFNFDSI